MSMPFVSAYWYEVTGSCIIDPYSTVPVHDVRRHANADLVHCFATAQYESPCEPVLYAMQPACICIMFVPTLRVNMWTVRCTLPCHQTGARRRSPVGVRCTRGNFNTLDDPMAVLENAHIQFL